MSSSSQPIDVVLPAGGRIDGAFAQEAGTTVKALLRVGDKTLLENTVCALREGGRIGRIVVIGPPEIGEFANVNCEAILPEGETGPDNIFRGLAWLQQQNNAANRVLIITTDLPFISARAIEQFIALCPPQTDICLPIIGRGEFDVKFPNLAGEWVRLRDGEWTLGNAFLLNSRALQNSRAHIERVFAARKSQIEMARLLGPLFIARFLCKQLTTAHIRQKCERILKCSGAAITGCAPELAFDIDAIEDYHYAVTHLNSAQNKKATL